MGNPEFLLGIILSFVGTTVCNFGMTLQKYSFFVQEHNPDAPDAAYRQRRTWAIGCVVSRPGKFLSYAFYSFCAYLDIQPPDSPAL